MDILKNRVESMNEFRGYINKLIPAIITDVAEHGIRTKSDCTLYKKDKERLNALIESIIPLDSNCSAWVVGYPYGGENNFQVKIKTNYRTGDFTVAYIEDFFTFNHVLKYGFNPLPAINLQEARESVASLEKLYKQRSELESQISRIESTYLGK